MTLGDKIKKYRSLNGWSQKELGQKVGFSDSTADSRIRKYENDIIAPKSELREKLADTLNVNISALSDINIDTLEDVMQALFLFEEKFGMTIERSEGKTILTFDEPNPEISGSDVLSTYLYAWYVQKKSVAAKDFDSYTEYEKWKGRFPNDLHDYWNLQLEKLDEFYDPIVKEMTTKAPQIKRKSELILQIRKLIESGFTITPEDALFGPNDGALKMTFPLTELLDDSSDERINEFARFLCNLNTLQEYGMEILRDIKTYETGTEISYILRHSPLMVICSDIDKLNEFINTPNKNDFDIDMFEKTFYAQLRTYDLDLTKEPYKHSPL